MTQCFAYSPKQIRCELEGSHSGDHAVKSTWSDEECAVPSGPAASSLIRKPAENPEGEPEKRVVSKCVACGHAHRDGDCKCGCQGFVG
jgi:hypothetical protein